MGEIVTTPVEKSKAGPLKPLVVKNKLAGNPSSFTPKFLTHDNLSALSHADFTDPKAIRALVALMDMHAVIGGAACHYGGPAALAEILSAVHGLVFEESKAQNKEWHELFHIINDAGHCENALYAVKALYNWAGVNFEKLKTFRQMESPLTGHGESHLFAEGVYLSNGPLGSAMGPSQGLAMADKLSGNNRVTLTIVSDGASMEGETKEAFAAIPGLAARNQMAPYVLMISDNNTKLTGRIDQDSFDMKKTFKSLESLGWKVLSVENGHDLKACYSNLKSAVEMARQNPAQPVAIHFKTIKGIGHKKSADSSSGGHGFPLKSASELPEFLTEIYQPAPVPAEFLAWTEELVKVEQLKKENSKKNAVASLFEGDEKIQNGISQAMIEAREKGFPVISVTSDLPGSTGVAGFRKQFPDSSFDVGVAESNMVSAASGFTKKGYIPVVDTFAQFGVTKGALPITMANLSQAPVICVFSHTGFQDAADGASHQALSYISMVVSIPHVEVYALTCKEEAYALMTQTIQKFADYTKQGLTPPTTVFFLGRENFATHYKTIKEANASTSVLVNHDHELGKSKIVYDSSEGFDKSVTLVGVGSMLPEAIKAAVELKKHKVGAVVVNPSAIHTVDIPLMAAALERTKGHLIIAEDHQKLGGAGQIILANIMESLTLHKFGVQGSGLLKCKLLAVNKEFGQSAYTANELYKKHGIDSESIVKEALKL